jgi:hypothetical protein
MVGRDHTNETVELLNVSSKSVFKCIECTFNNPTVSLV